MDKKVWALCFIGTVAWVCAGGAHADLINGDFSSGLTGWTTEGDVVVESGAASIGDEDPYSLLYQGVALAPGLYELEFDFSNLLSDYVPPSGPVTFPDIHFASLYFINDLSQFDLNTLSFDDAAALFDMDYTGPYNVQGVISASPLGQAWSHFTMTFDNNCAYAIPTFELLDFNLVSGDSEVLIDNVSVAIVPEPSTVLLLSIGLATGLLRRRKVMQRKLQ